MSRGRKTMPDELKVKSLTVCLPPELYEWVQKQARNVSTWMVEVLHEVKTAQDAETKRR